MTETECTTEVPETPAQTPEESHESAAEEAAVSEAPAESEKEEQKEEKEQKEQKEQKEEKEQKPVADEQAPVEDKETAEETKKKEEEQQVEEQPPAEEEAATEKKEEEEETEETEEKKEEEPCIERAVVEEELHTCSHGCPFDSDVMGTSRVPPSGAGPVALDTARSHVVFERRASWMRCARVPDGTQWVAVAPAALANVLTSEKKRGTIKIAARGAETALLTPFADSSVFARRIAFSRSGRFLATLGSDDSVALTRLARTADGQTATETVRSRRLDAAPRGWAWHGDARFAVATARAVLVHSTDDGRVRTLALAGASPAPVSAVGFLAADTVAVGFEDGTVAVARDAPGSPRTVFDTQAGAVALVAGVGTGADTDSDAAWLLVSFSRATGRMALWRGGSSGSSTVRKCGEVAVPVDEQMAVEYNSERNVAVVLYPQRRAVLLVSVCAACCAFGWSGVFQVASDVHWCAACAGAGDAPPLVLAVMTKTTLLSAALQVASTAETCDDKAVEEGEKEAPEAADAAAAPKTSETCTPSESPAVVEPIPERGSSDVTLLLVPQDPLAFTSRAEVMRTVEGLVAPEAASELFVDKDNTWHLTVPRASAESLLAQQTLEGTETAFTVTMDNSGIRSSVRSVSPLAASQAGRDDTTSQNIVEKTSITVSEESAAQQPQKPPKPLKQPTPPPPEPESEPEAKEEPKEEPEEEKTPEPESQQSTPLPEQQQEQQQQQQQQQREEPEPTEEKEPEAKDAAQPKCTTAQQSAPKSVAHQKLKVIRRQQEAAAPEPQAEPPATKEEPKPAEAKVPVVVTQEAIKRCVEPPTLGTYIVQAVFSKNNALFPVSSVVVEALQGLFQQRLHTVSVINEFSGVYQVVVLLDRALAARLAGAGVVRRNGLDLRFTVADEASLASVNETYEADRQMRVAQSRAGTAPPAALKAPSPAPVPTPKAAEPKVAEPAPKAEPKTERGLTGAEVEALLRRSEERVLAQLRQSVAKDVSAAVRASAQATTRSVVAGVDAEMRRVFVEAFRQTVVPGFSSALRQMTDTIAAEMRAGLRESLAQHSAALDRLTAEHYRALTAEMGQHVAACVDRAVAAAAQRLEQQVARSLDAAVARACPQPAPPPQDPAVSAAVAAPPVPSGAMPAAVAVLPLPMASAVLASGAAAAATAGPAGPAPASAPGVTAGVLPLPVLGVANGAALSVVCAMQRNAPEELLRALRATSAAAFFAAPHDVDLTLSLVSQLVNGVDRHEPQVRLEWLDAALRDINYSDPRLVALVQRELQPLVAALAPNAALRALCRPFTKQVLTLLFPGTSF